MRDTAILITTFLRDDMLFRCVDSIREFYPSIQIFVGDNGRPSDEKTEFLAERNATHLMVTFDCGVAGVRNESIALIPKSYKFLFVCEDDIVFTKDTKLAKLRKVLNASPKIGIASGMLKFADGKEQHYEGTHWIDGNTKYVRKLKDPEWLDAQGVKYCYCDLALNVFLMRRTVWERVKWDAQFKTALEHADFFCSIKYSLKGGKATERKNPWRVAYVPEVWAYHKTGQESPEYMRYRQRAAGFQLFAAKWGVRYSDSDYNKGLLDLVTYGKPEVCNTAKDRVLADAAGIMTRLGIKWWLNSGSCLGAIREKGFIPGDADIDFGIAPDQDHLWNNIQDAFIEAGFALYKAWMYKDIKVELSFKRDDVKIDLFFFKTAGGRMWFGAFGPDEEGRWGQYMTFMPRTFPSRLFDQPQIYYLRGVKCFVPSPPDEYLRLQYGDDWRTPKKVWHYWIHNKAIDREFLRRLDASLAGASMPAWAPALTGEPAQAQAQDQTSGVAALDMQSEPIAIGIKTFMRAPTLYRNLQSIKANCLFPYRLYIADDGPKDDEKLYRYQRLKAKGHEIIVLPFDCGISAGRNSIVKAVRERFVLMTDDDVTPADPGAVPAMKAVLDAVPEIGVVAAVIKGEAGEYFSSEGYAKGLRFEFEGSILRRAKAQQLIERVGDDGPLYVYADQVPNFFLARREVLDEVRWDNRIKVEYEHVDWFLALQKTRWKAAVCLSAHAIHLASPDAERDYCFYRRAASTAYLYSKWGLSGMLNQFQ